MSQAKQGDKVCVHYRGSLEDGTVFDSTFDKEPFDFTIGEDVVLAGFEKAVLGMTEGEEKTVTLTPEEAFGERREELVVDVARSQLPSDIEPTVGMRLKIRSREGEVSVVTVAGVSDETLTLDANPPLAGKNLTFEIKLVEIR